MTEIESRAFWPVHKAAEPMRRASAQRELFEPGEP